VNRLATIFYLKYLFFWYRRVQFLIVNSMRIFPHVGKPDVRHVSKVQVQEKMWPSQMNFLITQT